MNETAQARAIRGIALFVIATGLVASCAGLQRLNTWYLASDQYAFLSMAQDLRDGRVTRTDSLYDFLPEWRRGRFDAMSQTYQLHLGVLHSRYPPGFPAMLAVAGAVFGERGEHGLNPALYLVVFVLLARLAFLSLREEGEALAYGGAAASVWLLLLLPTDVHLWGITVARDLPAHLLGLLALIAAVRGRFVAAGFALGLACVVRPDSALYVTSLGCVALVRGGVVPSAGRGALGFLVGALPLFAYNWAVLGNPFAFTQGSEFRYFLAMFSPFPSEAHATSFVVPAGGGFRAAHFARTFPGNLALLSGSFGWLAVPVVVAVVWGFLRAPLLLAVFAPYAIAGTIFYGFWGHPDPRYLAGVSLCLMPLVATGAVLACQRAAEAQGGRWWRIAAWLVLAAVVARGWLGVAAGFVAAPRPTAIALAMLAAFSSMLARPGELAARMRALGPVAAAVLLMVLGLVEMAGGAGWRDPYQGTQIVRSRSVVEQVVPAGSVVITSPALGRPAENLSHYTHARAVYDAELAMFPVAPARPALFHKLRGRRVFYLLPPGQKPRLDGLDALMPRLVRRISRADALDWFLNPRHARGGAVLWEIDLDETRLPWSEPPAS